MCFCSIQYESKITTRSGVRTHVWLPTTNLKTIALDHSVVLSIHYIKLCHIKDRQVDRKWNILKFRKYFDTFINLEDPQMVFSLSVNLTFPEIQVWYQNRCN